MDRFLNKQEQLCYKVAAALSSEEATETPVMASIVNKSLIIKFMVLRII